MERVSKIRFIKMRTRSIPAHTGMNVTINVILITLLNMTNKKMTKIKLVICVVTKKVQLKLLFTHM